MNRYARRLPRFLAIIALVALVALARGAAAGTNLPEGYPDSECGERPEVLRWGAIEEPQLVHALEEIAA